MPEPILYIRGFPPTLSFETVPDDLLDDFKVIISLPDKVIAELCKLLSEVQGFLNPKALLETIQTIIKDTNTAKVVQRVIINISPSQFERMKKYLDEKSKEKGSSFDQKQFERLNQVLKILIQPYPSLVRFQKAERLTNITGQELETVELICDLRPIFNEDRKNVEGMMPYTRLHIVATGEDGLPKAFEVELTHQQVVDLAEKTEKAKSKLETLHQTVEKWLPNGLPDLPLTRIPKKESSDG